MPSATPRDLANPWRAFLADVDRQLPRPIEIHCLGGFVAALYYDLPRPTNDLDYIDVVPRDAMATLQEIAGVESRRAHGPLDDAAWEEMFAALVAYKTAHGDCNVPARWGKNLALARWVSNQRTNFKLGTLDPGQIRRLHQIGFVSTRKGGG